MQSSIKLTEDVKSRWLDVVRRMQAELAKVGNCGDAIITITVLVNERNEPTDWLDPTVRKIEPRVNRTNRSPERRHLLTALGAGERRG